MCQNKTTVAIDPSETVKRLGGRLRWYRLRQGRTLQDVAEKSGFSRSLLSKIENGKVIPPVATLVRIAEALGTHISQLLEDRRDSGTAYTTWLDVGSAFISTDRGYSISPIATQVKNKKMQPFLFRVRRGEVKEHSVSHAGEELVFVVSGSIRFRVGAVEYALSAGDSLYFDARITHNVLADSEEAYYLDVFVD